MNHPLGQACALGAAITWACALVLFKRSGERTAPVALNLYKNAVGLGLLIVTLSLLILCGRDSLGVLRAHTLGEIGLLLLSGAIGIALADTLFFHSLNLIGVGLISIVDCSYSPFAILFSWLLLTEKLTLVHYVGAALIVAGVFTGSPHARPGQRTRGQIVGGMLLGTLSMALMALAIVIVKPVLETMPLLWATTVRQAAGFACLAVFALVGRQWQRHWVIFRPATTWRFALPASLLGAYASVLLWIAGFKYTEASIAAVLNQTSVVIASVLAALFLKERFGPRQVTALVFALAGVAIMTAPGYVRAALECVGWTW